MLFTKSFFFFFFALFNHTIQHIWLGCYRYTLICINLTLMWQRPHL